MGRTGWKDWAWGAALAGALVAARPAQATVVVQPSLEQMTARSGVVIHAVVEEQTQTTGEDARLLTLTRLRVLPGGAVKGAKDGDTFTLYQVGGRDGNRVVEVVGMNHFAKGEEVVLFASAFLAGDTVKFLQEQRKGSVPAATLHPAGGWVVTFGIGLGKYAVTRTGSGAMAVEELGDVTVARRDGARGPMLLDHPVHFVRQPLDVFLDEVRAQAAATRRAP